MDRNTLLTKIDRPNNPIDFCSIESFLDMLKQIFTFRGMNKSTALKAFVDFTKSKQLRMYSIFLVALK
jgi:hypothetical protein